MKNVENVENSVAQAKRLYYRDYYQKNRERIKENHLRYWRRKALSMLGGNAVEVQKAGDGCA